MIRLSIDKKKTVYRRFVIKAHSNDHWSTETISKRLVYSLFKDFIATHNLFGRISWQLNRISFEKIN